MHPVPYCERILRSAAAFWIIFISLLCVAGITMPRHAELPHNPAAQSWDQANLKRNDVGCPTAVFIAPKGELVQCQYGTTITDPPAHSVMPGYPTIDAAAIAGLAAVMLKPSAPWYEWGGNIIRASNGYVPLPPDTSFAAQHVHIEGSPGEIVATYHTHVCNARFAHEFFSPTDLGDPIFMHRAVFMGDVCTGLVHRFLPGEKPDALQVNGDDSPFSSRGKIVGKFTTTHAAQ